MNTKQIVAVRLEPQIIARIDALKASFSTAFCDASRSDVIRNIIPYALELFERKRRPARASKQSPTPKRGRPRAAKRRATRASPRARLPA